MGEWEEGWLTGDGHDAHGIRGLAAAGVRSHWLRGDHGRCGSRGGWRRWWWRLSGLLVWEVWVVVVVVVVVAMSRLRMGGSVHRNVPLSLYLSKTDVTAVSREGLESDLYLPCTSFLGLPFCVVFSVNTNSPQGSQRNSST